MGVLIKLLEVLFLLGVVGCLITIPLAAWGYCSVLFEKDSGGEVTLEEPPPSLPVAGPAITVERPAGMKAHSAAAGK